MPRATIASLVTGLILFSAGLLVMRRTIPLSVHDSVLDGGRACPAAPVLILEPAGSGPSVGSLIVFHGIGANRVIMLPLGTQFAAAGFRVFLVDSPGHGKNPTPFSFAANEACAAGLLAKLEGSHAITRTKTVLLGHSMGGGLVMRLADEFPAAGTIALSGAPIVRPHRLAANLLLVAPQFDIPAISAQERALAAAAGPERDAPEDFRQSRAFRLLPLPMQTHTSPIFSAVATRPMLRWALNSVGAFEQSAPPPDYRFFHGALLGLAGLLLWFPPVLEMCARVAHLHSSPDKTPGVHPGFALLAWLAAGIFAALLLLAWQPPAGFHLFGGDYFAWFILVAGLPLAFVFGYLCMQRGGRMGLSATALIAGVVAALIAVVAIAAWCNGRLAELWPIGVRAVRIPLLALALLPASFAEELALGPTPSFLSLRWPGRVILALCLRGAICLVMLAALWCGVSAALFPVLFTLPLAGVSLSARLGTDLVRHRTGSAAAAAIFGAILMAWFVAAAFPLA